MKHVKLASLAFTSALLFSSTSFAHLSLKGEVPNLSNFYNWSGFYLGLNVGAVNHTMNITDTDATSFNATIQQVSNPKLTGGLQVGYRKQLDFMRVSGVYGLEFSANFSNTKFSEDYGSPFALYQLDAKNNLKNVYLLQLTGGISADRTLLFLAAGLSYVNITGSVENVDGIPFFNSFSVGDKKLGTAFGAGIEYAFCDALSARVKIDIITPNTYSTSDNVDDSFRISNSIVQAVVGLNYNFA